MARCCSGFCDTAERQFSATLAVKDLSRYRRKGPDATTRLLRDGLVAAGAVAGSLLDIGSGVGALAFELLDRGIQTAEAVDASSAHVAAATQEAERRGRSSAFRAIHDDFTSASAQFAEATIVTLDRVVCCYPMYAPLLEAAVGRSLRWLALSYPRDLWYVRAMVGLENQTRRLSGNPFRSYVHPAIGIADLIGAAGFRLVSRAQTAAWAADVYQRGAA
ncbi:MAG: methyltransferase domain-containing protein [Vicinamibacteraceae bacterium]